MFHSPNLKISILICPTNPKKTLASMLICSKFKFTCYLWAITNWNILQQSMHQIPGTPGPLFCLNDLYFDGPWVNSSNFRLLQVATHTPVIFLCKIMQSPLHTKTQLISNNYLLFSTNSSNKLGHFCSCNF